MRRADFIRAAEYADLADRWARSAAVETHPDWICFDHQMVAYNLAGEHAALRGSVNPANLPKLPEARA